MDSIQTGVPHGTLDRRGKIVDYGPGYRIGSGDRYIGNLTDGLFV